MAADSGSDDWDGRRSLNSPSRYPPFNCNLDPFVKSRRRCCAQHDRGEVQRIQLGVHTELRSVQNADLIVLYFAPFLVIFNFNIWLMASLSLCWSTLTGYHGHRTSSKPKSVS